MTNSRDEERQEARISRRDANLAILKDDEVLARWSEGDFRTQIQRAIDDGTYPNDAL
ncbi:unannotated protein [freshwater metagenome]|uniref:Unannotated protein n=1 Tax=freshwater metagenome TaxID=449393 RepID=A0A6J7LTY8_9ZZZZ